MENTKVFDNPELTDRYTVIFLDWTILNDYTYQAVFMSEDQGIFGFFETGEIEISNDLGTEIQFNELPEQCKKAVKKFYSLQVS